MTGPSIIEQRPSTSLPIVLSPGTGQNFSCHSCTRCCRDLLVELSQADRDRIDRLHWVHGRSLPSYVKLQGKWVLNKHDDGRCVFLLDDGKCEIHARSGFGQKPLACRLYPFAMVPTDDHIRVNWRFDCPTVAASRGRPIREHADELEELAGELLSDRVMHAAAVELQPGIIADPAELDALDRAIDGLLTLPRLSSGQRLLGLVWMADNLARARLEKVRRDRFQTLVELLAGSWPEEMDTCTLTEPDRRQCGLFRQYVFAHAGYVSVADLKGGLGAKLILRWRQLRTAESFRKGLGNVPTLAHIGLEAPPTFEDIEGVEAGSDAAMTECLLRYVRSRVLSRTIYGPAYYRWPVTRGLAAMGLAVAVMGWWCRAFAASRKSRMVEFEDMTKALAIVDGTAGRVPVLGAASERWRVDHLLAGGVIGALLRRFLPVRT